MKKLILSFMLIFIYVFASSTLFACNPNLNESGQIILPADKGNNNNQNTPEQEQSKDEENKNPIIDDKLIEYKNLIISKLENTRYFDSTSFILFENSTKFTLYCESKIHLFIEEIGELNILIQDISIENPYIIETSFENNTFVVTVKK